MSNTELSTEAIEREFAGQTAPLYVGEGYRTYLDLDLETGEVGTYTVRSSESGHPEAIWHGRIQTWEVPSTLHGDTYLDILTKARKDLETVLAGSTITTGWDGGSQVGSLSDAATDAYLRVQDICDAYVHDAPVVWDVDDFSAWEELRINVTAEFTDDELAAETTSSMDNVDGTVIATHAEVLALLTEYRDELRDDLQD